MHKKLRHPVHNLLLNTPRLYSTIIRYCIWKGKRARKTGTVRQHKDNAVPSRRRTQCFSVLAKTWGVLKRKQRLTYFYWVTSLISSHVQAFPAFYKDVTCLCDFGKCACQVIREPVALGRSILQEVPAKKAQGENNNIRRLSLKS
jgi:hypothetical protein